jgi:hypothetical protein
MKKWISSISLKGMLLAGTFLGIGALPCPDCGTPMIFHIWPVAGLLVIAQFVRKRRDKEREIENTQSLPVRFGTPLGEEDQR